MPHRLTGMAIAMVAVALAGAGCAASTTPGGSATEGTQPQYGRLPCGTSIAGHAAPSSPHDRISLAVTTVKHTSDSITVSYAISSSYRNQPLPLPIEPTPPTAVLLHNGAISAVQATTPRPLPPGAVNGQVPQAYMLGKKSYRGQLTIRQLCPGTNWRHIWQSPTRYQIGIVMTRQPSSSPSTQPKPSPALGPLTVAFIPLN